MLEGPFFNGQMTPFLNVLGELPLDQPYNYPPYNYNGNESVGIMPTFDVVDWILVDVVRYHNSGSEPALELMDRKACFVLKDGQVVDLDGVSNISFDFELINEFYLRINHRNHLSILSAVPLIDVDGLYSYDFTISSDQAMGQENTQKLLAASIWGMIAADGDASGQIDNHDKNQVWLPQDGLNGYYVGDYNLDTQVDEDDKIAKWELNVGHASYSIMDTIIAPFQCGDSLLDFRDGRKYATIQIGQQCWMKENLDVGVFVNGTTDHSDNDIIEKHCYNNEPDSCSEYGGLYMWDETMQYSTDTTTNGICPPEPGWHLPTDFDWKVLEGFTDTQFPIGDPEWDNLLYRGFDVGGHLKDTTTRFWLTPNTSATNSSQFTGLGGGIKYGGQNVFSQLGQSGLFWCSDLYSTDNPYYRELHFAGSQVGRLFIDKSRSLSVRCINTTYGLNLPPNQPSNPLPEDGSTDVGADTSTIWSCNDPNGDDLTYNVYFGLGQDPPLLLTDYSDTIYNPGKLFNDSTYYWKIVAYDTYGDSTEGPIWLLIPSIRFPTFKFSAIQHWSPI